VKGPIQAICRPAVGWVPQPCSGGKGGIMALINLEHANAGCHEGSTEHNTYSYYCRFSLSGLLPCSVLTQAPTYLPTNSRGGKRLAPFTSCCCFLPLSWVPYIARLADSRLSRARVIMGGDSVHFFHMSARRYLDKCQNSRFAPQQAAMSGHLPFALPLR
jgi:hypothetical protein